MPPVDLHVIIVTYRVRDLLRDCLKTVAGSDLSGFTKAVTIVDNDSDDGSAEMVEAEFPQFRLVRNENLGFSQANNRGMRLSDARYHLLLNPDTLLPPSALRQAVEHMDQDRTVGVLGPRLVLADGQLDLACRRSYPTPGNSLAKMSGLARLFPNSRLFGAYNLTYLDPRVPADVEALVGAFMLLRAGALAEVGGLDETFFMYGEDLDLCSRLRAAGWRALYWPEITVLHYKRASSSQSNKAGVEFYRAMRLFYDKHQAGDAVPPARLAVRSAISLLQRRSGGRSTD